MKRRKRGVNVFSKMLTALMKEKGIGVREAARLAGVGASTIVSWRSGAVPEDFLAVRKLAEALGTSLTYLLTGEHDARVGGTIPPIAEVFENGEFIFDGYAKITVQRLLPKASKREEKK